MNILPSECDCPECSKMCHAPCCGTIEDMQVLIEAGYGNRLMYDDLPGGPEILKAALKGFEGCKAPWALRSMDGCTFWNAGKCELHDLGLKPLQGKLAHHSLNNEEKDYIGEIIKDSWEREAAKELIDKWINREDNERDRKKTDTEEELWQHSSPAE